MRLFSMQTRNTKLENFALSATRWVGSASSIVLHTILFVGSFSIGYFGFVSWDRILLVMTTVVSLEAIYLSIFIQMSLNFANQTIEAVEEDIDEIQKDVDEIQKDVDVIQEDMDELQEDVEEISEADEADVTREAAQSAALDAIRQGLSKLAEDIERFKSQ